MLSAAFRSVVHLIPNVILKKKKKFCLYIKAIVNNSHISKWLKRSSDMPIKWFTADQIEKKRKRKKELCILYKHIMQSDIHEYMNELNWN